MPKFRRALQAGLASAVLAGVTAGAAGAVTGPRAVPAQRHSAAANPYGLAQPGVLHLAADFSVAPNQYLKGNKYAGIDVDLCNAIAKDLKLKISWTNLAFDSLIPGLQAHRFDALCTGVFITKAREQVMNMVPYVRWGVTMGVTGSELAKDRCTPSKGNFLPCFEKFAGQTVATEAGGFEQQLLVTANSELQKKGMAPMKILGFAQVTQAYQAFTNGTASGVWVDDPQFHFFDQNNGNKYRAAFGGDDPTPLSLTTVKSNTALASAFVKALKTIKADGTYGKILKKWDVEAVPSFTINPPSAQ